MKFEKLLPAISSKIEFHYSKVKFVPVDMGCYTITNFTGDILYIGLTKNLQQRLSQHLENPAKTDITSLGKAYYFMYKVVSEERDLFKIERGWLNQFELDEGELPLLNSIHSPI